MFKFKSLKFLWLGNAKNKNKTKIRTLSWQFSVDKVPKHVVTLAKKKVLNLPAWSNSDLSWASKTSLNQACKWRPSSSLSFPAKIWHQIFMKLPSSISKLSSQQQGVITKTKNCPRSLPPRFSLTSDSESKIKKYA